MAKLVIIQPNGLMRFAHHFEPKWKFWKKRLALTTQMFTARDYGTVFEDVRTLGEDSYPNDIVLSINDGLLEDGTLLGYYKYWVVFCRKGLNHKPRYYDNDTERYSRKLHRLISKPHFCKDINKAEFIKSPRYASEVIMRCRQAGNKYVGVREVYVYRENELLKHNIVVVLRDKENKKARARFIRDYDLGATGEYKIPMTDTFKNAKRYTYDKFLTLYDDIHAKHKNLMVFPKIWTGGREPLAKEVDGRETVMMTMKLNNNMHMLRRVERICLTPKKQ